ncbi:5'-3' exonuclease [Bacillus sp. FJAT-29937]|uniref:5'-3' exonuclease n=1 Tax=Bacillus sp. FJAT-29937 TaxID=1720553 RepID=UPI000835FDB8|nr:5'-3' exonuclease H3TH domain-containing protein [Bacillus sp. FJAT-29937]
MQMSIFDLVSHEEKDVSDNAALLIDGNNLLNRAFYATRESMKQSPNGKYTNGVNMFLQMMLKYKRDLNVSHLAVFFDKTRGFRENLYPGYKGTRNTQPEELKEQFPLLEELLKAMNVSVFADEEMYEADDLIASLAKQLESHMKVYLLSNDEDLLQLVTDQVIQICRKGKEDVFFDRDVFYQNYGLQPFQMIDLKGLMGDTSDEYPGVPGIGEKGAQKLLQKYGTVESIYDNLPTLPKEFNRYKKKLENGKDEGFLSKKLATLVSSIQVIENRSEIQIQWDMNSLLDYCRNLGLRRLQMEVESGRYS